MVSLKLGKKDKGHKEQQLVHSFYDALAGLPYVDPAVEGRTKVYKVKSLMLDVGIMYGQTIPLEVHMPLPKEFLTSYYALTETINHGMARNRVIYVAVMKYDPKIFATLRVKAVKNVLRSNARFFRFPRTIWLTLEKATSPKDGKNPSIFGQKFFINSVFDDNPFDISQKMQDLAETLKAINQQSPSQSKFFEIGAFGMLDKSYFYFVAVARREYVKLVNERLSLFKFGQLGISY